MIAESDGLGMPIESYLRQSENGPQTKETYSAHLLRAQHLGPKLTALWIKIKGFIYKNNTNIHDSNFKIYEMIFKIN